tara:strand:+ start:181 stop:393 length:213 start_codon:yes stop_codon:yes gene_type:complete
MNIGDLVEFRRGSIGVPWGSLGLVVDMSLQVTKEPGRDNFFLYHIKTFDGRVRRFSDSYLKKVTPGLYSA